MRLGRRVALDVGSVRIGVAASDERSILATPLAYIKRNPDGLASCVDQVLKLENVIEVYVGLPLNLDSRTTQSTDDAVEFARALQAMLAIDVRMVDERFSTKIASQSLRTKGLDSREQRGVIDSAAAAVILEAALEHEKKTATAPGIKISEYAD
jgi:putative Holliday junction resolvase